MLVLKSFDLFSTYCCEDPLDFREDIARGDDDLGFIGEECFRECIGEYIIGGDGDLSLSGEV